MSTRLRRGVGITLVVMLAGGSFVVVQTVGGHLTGSRQPTAAVLATAVVALLFLPLYSYVERLVDRLPLGGRQPSFHVLSDLTALSRATSTDASNLAGVAEAIARGLGASSCRLTVIHPGLRDRTYAWADGDGAADAEDHAVLPIRQGAEQIGTLAVDREAVTGLHTRRRQLLEDITNSLGPIVAVSRLGIELERQFRAARAHAEDIATSRRQAVAEMDSERRLIERNLHDGAQHHLVSLRMTLGLVEHEVASGQLDQARDRLKRLVTQIDSAEAVLAETATGVSSILLAERGLVAALNSDLAGAHPPTTVTSHGVLSGRRFPAEVEAAVYFCCLEAVNNARKHAPGAAVEVQLCEVNGTLHFTVRDEGPGFAPPGLTLEPGGGAGSPGRGLRNVTARITAVGGRISIRSVPDVGTTIEGTVALAPEQALADQVRELVREARVLYDGSAESAGLRELQAQLDQPLPAGPVGPARVADVRRAEALKARSALRALDAVVRSSPLGGDRAIRLRYQLEQIRSEAHELTEIDLLDELRSGTLPLSADDRQVAEELLGAAGAEPRARLGLGADADTGEVRRAVGQQLARWQRRASHPVSTRAVRDAAEVLARTCEELLARLAE